MALNEQPMATYQELVAADDLDVIYVATSALICIMNGLPLALNARQTTFFVEKTDRSQSLAPGP